MTKSDSIPRTLSPNVGFEHAAVVRRFLTRALFVPLPETWDIVRGRARGGPGGVRPQMGPESGYQALYLTGGVLAENIQST